jgi:uncharacterized protein
MRFQNLSIPRDRLDELCRRHHIQRLSLFGSILRDDFRDDSDVDVLVQFDPAFPVGFRIFDLEEELSALLGGRRVDIVNEKFLNHRLRERVLETAEEFYAEG